MKSLKNLIASARRARIKPAPEDSTATGSSKLADRVLASLSHPENETPQSSDWLVLGRWAAGVACAIALITVFTGPQFEELPDPSAPNPLAAMGGW